MRRSEEMERREIKNKRGKGKVVGEEVLMIRGKKYEGEDGRRGSVAKIEKEILTRKTIG